MGFPGVCVCSTMLHLTATVCIAPSWDCYLAQCKEQSKRARLRASELINDVRFRLEVLEILDVGLSCVW